LSIHECDVSTPKDVRDALGADLLMTGQMRSLGGVMKLDIDLLDAKSLKPVTSSLSFSDPVTNLATWQNDIVQKLAGALDLPFDEEMTNAISFGTTMIPAAFSRYIEGLSFRYLEQLDKINSAISLFTDALKYDPRFIMAYIALGEAYWEKFKLLKEDKWLDKVESVYSQAVQLTDSSALLLTLLGKLYRETGQYDKAIQYLNDAIELQPFNYSAHLELATAYENGDYPALAEEYYRKLLKLRPGYIVGYSCLGVFYWTYEGRYHDAAKMFEHHAKLAPNDILAYNDLGVMYLMLGDNQEAERSFQRSLNIKSNSFAYSNLGTLYFYENRYADAAAMYSAAVKLVPDDGVLWGNLGDAYRYLSNHEQDAQNAYKKALDLVLKELIVNPKNVDNLSLAALYRIRTGDEENALIDISEALIIAPDDLRVLRKGIFINELAGQREEAILNFEKYIQLGGSLEDVSNDPELHVLISDSRIQELLSEE